MDTKDSIIKFMQAADQTVATKPDPELMYSSQATLYERLITEEFDELLTEFQNKNYVNAAKEITDLIWVLEGYCHSVGIPLQAVFDETARSNHSKTVGGKLIKREDGKVLKPQTYSPADPKTAIFGNRTKVIRFTAPWCAPCKSMVAELERVDMSGVDYEVVNIDENQDLVVKEGIRSIPTLVRIAPDGSRTVKNGFMTAAAIQSFVNGE